MKTNLHSDVIVIGAGLSGLTAALALARAGKRVHMIEARDRVGGRTNTTAASDGTPVDVGGQWVGPTQDRVLKLLSELNIQTYPQFHEGYKQLKLCGRRSRYLNTIPSLPLHNLLDLQLSISKLERLARQIPVEAPGTAKHAAAWDAISVGDWMRRNAHSKKVFGLLRAATHAVFAQEPEDISFLQFLFYLRSAGGLMKLLDVPNGAQEQRIVGGAQPVSDALLQQALAAGVIVHLNTPAWRIEHYPDGVIVTTERGLHSAAHLVVAMAPTEAVRIGWTPALPLRRRQLMQRMVMGSVIKCVAIYEEPFWRKDGWSGEMVCDEAPLRMTFDNSPADGRHGALVGFILGHEAAIWSEKGPELRSEAVLHQLSEFFGERAKVPAEYIDKDWCIDPWTHGCYVALMPPGVMARLGAPLRQPFGRIHWAGTETATVWNGYMDGAIEAGERAATEILASAG